MYKRKRPSQRVSGQHPPFPRRAGLWMALGLTALSPGAALALATPRAASGWSTQTMPASGDRAAQTNPIDQHESPNDEQVRPTRRAGRYATLAFGGRGPDQLLLASTSFQRYGYVRITEGVMLLLIRHSSASWNPGFFTLLLDASFRWHDRNIIVNV